MLAKPKNEAQEAAKRKRVGGAMDLHENPMGKVPITMTKGRVSKGPR
jgi:hypothetical protein